MNDGWRRMNIMRTLGDGIEVRQSNIIRDTCSLMGFNPEVCQLELGLFVTEHIVENEVITYYDGQLVTAQDVPRFSEEVS